MLKIALSGGPASGKSTSMSKLENWLTERGKKVFIVPETATELIVNGIAPGANISMEAFQELVLDKQLAKEDLYMRVVDKYYNSDDVVVLYDRSIIDQLAYVERDVLDKLLAERGYTMADIINRYDAVIHLVTSAKGTDCYTTANNAARRETAEEAIIADEKTLAANVIHPHLRVIDNSTNFEEKIQRVADVIFEMLGVPSPSEIERKYLIERPACAELEKLDYVSRSEIIQTYLVSESPDVERRVRQRGTEADGYSFYYTEKLPVSDVERIEKERRISVEDYVQYLAEADTSLHQIRKTRYCFVYENQYFELDIYPYSDKYAIVEIELSSVDDNVEWPPFLNLVKEVTDDERYKNHSIAANLQIPD